MITPNETLRKMRKSRSGARIRASASRRTV